MATKKKSIAKKSAAKRAAAKKPAAKRTAAKKKAGAKKKASTAKKPSTTKRVSPLEGASVDEWAKKLTGWQADALAIIRALVTRHAPGATLAMKWGQPVWEHNGPFAWLRPAAKHVSFGFWRGAEMNDPEGHLEGEGDRMRHLKMTSAADLKSLPIEGFVKQAVALNGANGDPTKRN
ncbi:MAG: hypothetical protein JWO86_9082 [Myxococcaceae bacterium]|nr:hypothetical protein [Myxococcaceae bacterium]